MPRHRRPIPFQGMNCCGAQHLVVLVKLGDLTQEQVFDVRAKHLARRVIHATRAGQQTRPIPQRLMRRSNPVIDLFRQEIKARLRGATHRGLHPWQHVAERTQALPARQQSGQRVRAPAVGAARRFGHRPLHLENPLLAPGLLAFDECLAQLRDPLACQLVAFLIHLNEQIIGGVIKADPQPVSNLLCGTGMAVCQAGHPRDRGLVAGIDTGNTLGSTLHRFVDRVHNRLARGRCLLARPEIQRSSAPQLARVPASYL